MEVLSKQGVNSYLHHLTVGDLKRFLSENKLPDNAKVLIERIEDRYYEEGGWAVYTKQNDHGDLNQYTPAWSCVKYESDNDLLFIDLHC